MSFYENEIWDVLPKNKNNSNGTFCRADSTPQAHRKIKAPTINFESQ